MLCQSCGTQNRAGRKFCSQCGESLSLACPACGTPNEPADRFCGECGTELGGGEDAPSIGRTQDAVPASTADERPQTSMERRLVSVLFADLVGFTALSEDRDPEEVRNLLTRYFDTCHRLIARYGGTVEKFIGDAVMAVWGTPAAREDDAERAVRAALELTAAVASLGSDVGIEELGLRAGVVTGKAAAAMGAQGQGMVAGDVVNTASRLQSVAQPGTVLVGEATRRITEATIAYEDAGSHALKGKVEPVPAWRALRVVAGRRGSLRTSGLEAPFVGRDGEMRLLKDLFHATVDEGKARLISIVGIGGIGKTRFSWEFEKYIDGLVDTVWWHRGRCLPYGDGVTYWALAEMVRMRAGIVEEEEAAAASVKLVQVIESYIEDPEERAWVQPRMSHLLGLTERSASEAADMFSAWRLFFERMSERSPVCLVFEDLQWADPSLLDFIEYLLDWSRNHPIFVLTLARPELSDRRPSWGAAKRNFVSIYLEPLAPDAMGELLRGLVPGLPKEACARINERAEGVPLYAVETVRMLLDRGLLRREGETYVLTGDLRDLDVPDSLHALIAARLDALNPQERSLLQDASVLGKSFTQSSLSALTNLPASDIEPLLSALVRKELVTLQADPMSPERGQYSFSQALVRTVAYDMLSKKQRKSRHLAVATYLEHSSGYEQDEIVEVVASHYLEAYRAEPDAPDAPEIRDKARVMLGGAARRAASLAATDQAQRYFERAAELADDVAEAELLESAGQMAWRGGRGDEAAAHYERSIALFESGGQTHPAARVSARLGEVIFTRDEVRAVERMEEAFSVLSGDEPDEDLATLAAQLARFYMLLGRFDIAIERIETSLEIAESLWLPEVLSQALNTKSMILDSKGRREESIALLKHALQIALDNALSSAALRAYGNLAYAAGDNFEEVRRYYDKGLELSRRLGDRVSEWWMIDGIAEVNFYLGDWDETLALWTQLMEEATALPYFFACPAAVVDIQINRGDVGQAKQLLTSLEVQGSSPDAQRRSVYTLALTSVLLAEGRNKEALAAAEDTLDVARSIGGANPYFTVGFLRAAEAALALDDEAKVEKLLADIEGLRPVDVTRSLQAQAARIRSLLAIKRGDVPQVEPGFKEAAGRFREVGLPFWIAVTLLEHGEWLTQKESPAEAAPLLSEAETTFERLRARPWLERLSRSRNTISVQEAGVG